MDPITIGMLGSAGVNFLGNLLTGNAQKEMNEAQIRAALQQAFAQMGLNLDQFEETLRQRQGEAAVEGIQQTPNRVGWRQNQAMAAAIMPGLRNVSVSSGIPGMDRFIPQVSGGLRIPEGGFGPETLKFFGEKAMLEGEQDLDRAVAVASGGRAPAPSYASYGEAGSAASNAQAALNEDLRKAAEEREKRRRQALQDALRFGPNGRPRRYPTSEPDYDGSNAIPR